MVSEALSLLHEFEGGVIDVLAPDHIRYEVPSAISTAVRTHRIPADRARDSIQRFLAWGFVTVGDDELIMAAYDVARRYGCAFYDGLYLALAEAAGCPLVYADGNLRRIIGDSAPNAVWLGDYRATT